MTLAMRYDPVITPVGRAPGTLAVIGIDLRWAAVLAYLVEEIRRCGKIGLYYSKMCVGPSTERESWWCSRARREPNG